MSSDNSSSSSSGIGCTGLFTVLLQVLFIGLKLTGYVEWEWWQVFLPFIIYIGLIVAIITVIIVAAAIVVIGQEMMK